MHSVGGAGVGAAIAFRESDRAARSPADDAYGDDSDDRGRPSRAGGVQRRPSSSNSASMATVSRASAGPG